MALKTASIPLELRSAYGIRRIVAAFGVFDGVHLGHRRILDRVLALAGQTDATPTVITFDTHPRVVVSSFTPPLLLTPLPQRLRLLADAGIQAAVLLPFGPAMAALSPEDFLLTYVFAPGGPDVLGVCIGSAWRFGRGGTGDVGALTAVAAPLGCRVESVTEEWMDGQPISSTRIREAVQTGRLDQAAILLGRPFAVCGTVTHGKGIGGPTLGCPTANLQDPDIVLPPDGVYAARARRLAGGTELPGVVYVGSSPTFVPEGTLPPPRSVELHLFGMAGSLYGEEIEIAFVARLRADARFASAGELKAQIARDIAAARQRLGLPPEKP
jgi:riboflavin kinase / FMN adenylyltransferase